MDLIDSKIKEEHKIEIEDFISNVELPGKKHLSVSVLDGGDKSLER